MIVFMHFNCLHITNFTKIFITVWLYVVNVLLNIPSYENFLLLTFVLYLQTSFQAMFPSEWKIFFSITFRASLLMANVLHFVCLKRSTFSLPFILRALFWKHKEHNSVVFWVPFFLLRCWLSHISMDLEGSSRSPATTVSSAFRLLSLCFMFSNCHTISLDVVYLYSFCLKFIEFLNSMKRTILLLFFWKFSATILFEYGCCPILTHISIWNWKNILDLYKLLNRSPVFFPVFSFFYFCLCIVNILFTIIIKFIKLLFSGLYSAINSTLCNSV